MIKATQTQTVALMLAGLLLTLTGCQTTGNTVTDAGCQIWREYGIEPSRADTSETQDGLIRLNRGMEAAC